MSRFRYSVLLISLLVYTVDCDSAVSGIDNASSALGTTQNTDIRSVNSTQRTFEVPYRSMQIEAFNTTSDRTPLFHAPLARLLRHYYDSAAVSVEPNTGCLFVTVKLSKPYNDKEEPVRDYVSNEISSRVGLFSKIYPLKLKFFLVGYTAYGSKQTITTTGWQPMTSYSQSVTLTMNMSCPGDVAWNETLSALQNDPANFASRLFLAFAQTAPTVRSAPMCIDTKHLPYDAIINASMERLSTGQNYVYMQPSDYTNFTKTLVAIAVEKMLDKNEFVDEDEMDKLVSEVSVLFPFSTTTSDNFTAEMWAATISATERADIKLRRLDDVLSRYRTWVSLMAAGGKWAHSLAPDLLWRAFTEVRQDSRMDVIDGKAVLKALPMYRVNLEVLRLNAPVCIGNVSFTRISAEYTGTAPANVDEIVLDDGNTLKCSNGNEWIVADLNNFRCSTFKTNSTTTL
ncbi:uncharacterized protein LOC129601791 isoform X2 [Paramacrobiotus metropolitanus]|uniref:uncharacterized protein LOC129601791 isoform X2 n=1 Tax=Paramacrobiotus metropolitanus TaxID=2943436 RepID=UPI002446423E|nr:uncharacterized protein LOC129601791 isoform X2 [Paramacrobiotus metropolitanus]